MSLEMKPNYITAINLEYVVVIICSTSYSDFIM